MTTEYYIKKEEVCQCRSCKKTFHQSEVVKTETEHNGHKTIDRSCPHCGSNTYGTIDYPVPEEELIYKNGKFYTYNGKHIRQYIDKYENEE